MQSADNSKAREEARERGTARAAERKTTSEAARRRQSEQRARVESAARRRDRPSLWRRFGAYSGYAAFAVVALALAFGGFIGGRRPPGGAPVNDDAYVRRVNEGGRGYTLGRNRFFEGVSLSEAKAFAKIEIGSEKGTPRCAARNGVSVPKNYNFYSKYPRCRFAETQRRCAGAYIEVPLSALRNRHCLAHGATGFRPSVDFAFACNASARGCAGGELLAALRFLRGGVVSDACWQARMADRQPLACPAEQLAGCERVRVSGHCQLVGGDEVKREIQLNGPVVTAFPLYRDFLSYKSGTLAAKASLGGLALAKVIGWETAANATVWLLDAAWGSDWGEGGVARVADSPNFAKNVYAIHIAHNSLAENRTFAQSD